MTGAMLVDVVDASRDGDEVWFVLFLVVMLILRLF